MPPLLPSAEAGPSTSKRIANFADSDDDEVEIAPLARKLVKTNGHGHGRKELNERAAGGGKSGVWKQKETERRDRAEMLLAVRQELPFYQGMFIGR
jgi:hypothetical protein